MENSLKFRQMSGDADAFPR